MINGKITRGLDTNSRAYFVYLVVQQCSNYITISLVSHGSKVILKRIMNIIDRKLEAEINVVQAVF